ncbi:LIC_10190 family membrane protein [Flavobacterium sangjuense]|uniref:DUF8201 domain-containing protein n=1 Tax=Flavobacterium sangjuense TaxID=2518177 RepID=A0A4P7PTM6_9FLAO|nr:hypothetical protein [Flavobacterium sangjuense]QBZ98301.1 hypothetical protein GS03_01806 [Flavobacterium sangjuense]
MILILLSWLYIFFTAFSFGISFSKALRIRQYDIITTTILGLFPITLLATIWAFFGPIAIAFHAILIVLSILFWYRNKAVFILIWQTTLSKIKSFSFTVKILFAFSSLLIIAQSASLPFIIDNESYYVQTIKWLNEYGFVKGLANLHLFFGQASGWHITQSVYSFSFLYDKFNDLNGFCLLLVNLFAFQKLHSYFTKGNRMDLLFGLLPLTYAFLFQFISSPSPDFPVYVFALILFSKYLQNEATEDTFIIITIFALFAVFIKVTAFVLLLFPLILLLKHFAVLKKQLLLVSSLGGIVLLLFVIKNTMLTGYPLFPLLCFRMDDLDYTVPAIIMNFFFSKGVMHSFYIDHAAFSSASPLDLVKHYFLQNGMSRYIGIASLLTLLVTPIIIFKKRLPKALWTIYFAFLVLAVVLCFSSPQYRFYVYFTLFFLMLWMSLWITNPKWILRFYALSLMVVGILVFVPLSFENLTANALLSQNSTFHLKNILIPEPNSKWKPEYKGDSVGNMLYHSPVDTSFFWVTGNGNLPCVNAEQVKYFEQGFFYIPQQRSTDLNDGFYAQKISGHE